MTNRLTEQQLQEELLDEIGDFTKAITKKIGQGVGAFKGAGQKVKGVAKRSVDALGNAYTQGKQQTQKAVAGQDYKAPQPKAQAQGQAQPQGQTKTKPTGVMKNLAKNLGNVALDTVAGSGYDYRKGVNPNPTKQVPVGKQDTQAQTQTQTQAQKRTKTGGKVAGKVSDTKSAQAQRDRRAAKKGGSSAVSKGIDQAQIDGANKGIANMQKKQAGQTATKVPGQKAPVTQVDKNKDGKDDKTGKPISNTATKVGDKTGVAGGVALDNNNPEHKALIAAINKADPTILKSVNKLDTGSKGKLLKGLQVA